VPDMARENWKKTKVGSGNETRAAFAPGPGAVE